MTSEKNKNKLGIADAAGFDSVAEAYLHLLKSRGVDWLFANAGTDFAPIIEALTKGGEDGRAMPEAVAITHENVAVGMAHGYYQMTGRPQAVMFHVNVGTANALMGLINAARDNVPILFTSGRTPITEGGRIGSRDLPIHWGQEMFDQAGMLREVVKWDYELRYGEQVEAMVDRALATAMSEPKGSCLSEPAARGAGRTIQWCRATDPHHHASTGEECAEWRSGRSGDRTPFERGSSAGDRRPRLGGDIRTAGGPC